MISLDKQQWKTDSNSEFLKFLTGTQVSLRLVQHLVGVSGPEDELARAREQVSNAKVGEHAQDAYGRTYTRVK